MRNEIAELKIKQSERRWKHRRRMAYTSFVFVSLVLIAAITGNLPTDAMTVDVIKYICGGFIVVILSYVGFSTADDVGMNFGNRYKRFSPDEIEPEQRNIFSYDDDANMRGGQG